MYEIRKKLVSIITPCYNSERYISDTINSVLNQKYQNWEMIIVDDFSKDNSIKIIKNFIKNDDRIQLIKLKKNRGAGYCRNIAIKNAKGQYYAFLDSDDLWYPNKLKKQIKFMSDNHIAFSYTRYDFISESGKLKNKSTQIKSVSNYSNLLKTNHIGCLTVMYDTIKINKNDKLYMSNMRCRQDLSLWLKILKIIDFAYGYDEILSSYRIRKYSISSNKIRVIYYQWKLYRNIEKFSFPKSIYLLIFYLYFGIIKYFRQSI